MARKGFYEELNAKRYLTTLTPKMFAYVQEVFDGDNNADKKELAKSLLPKIIDKAIPTQFTGEEGGAIVIRIASEIANKYDFIEPVASGSREGHDKI